MIRPMHTRRRPQGFTLLEVLLVAVLSVLLLAGVWSLYSIYVGLFDKGQRRTEQAQLVRSLLRQVCDDLESAIQDTAARPPRMPATTPLRRFGLFGTAQSLQIDIMRAAPREEDFLPKESASSPLLDEPSGPKAPEFRTVVYEFIEPPQIYAEEGLPEKPEERNDMQSGLTRRELDWEIPGQTQLAEAQSRPFASSGPSTASTTTTWGSSPDTSAKNPPVDDKVLHVPEVVSLGFRYFDGKVWTDQWNSIQRKSLPAAIEVTMKIKPPEAPKPRRAEGTELSGPKEAASEDNEDARITVHDAASTASTRQEPELPTHRIVVCLPVSSLAKPPTAVDATVPQLSVPIPMEPPPPVIVAPVTIPPVSVPAPVRPATPADQHMRNQ